MVENNTTEVKVQELLKKLEEQGILAYYSKVNNESNKEEIFQVFVPYEDIDVIETKYGNLLKEYKIVLSPAVEGKILKLFLNKYKDNSRVALKIGNEIRNLEGNGFAVYLNWTNRGFVVHKYSEGKFQSRACKKTSFWETENGTWIVGFENCQQVLDFVKSVNKFLEEHFGVNYSVNYHRACSAYKACKGA